MPSCSTAKNPKGHEIIFTEEDHSYRSIIDNQEISYISGTSFLGKYFPQFDPSGEITRRCALKEGISVEEIKAKWKAKGAESCRLGTRMHETIEDVLLDNKFRNTPENEVEQQRFSHAINIAKKLKSTIDILGVEKIVFDPQLKIAGTIDLFAKTRKNNVYLIIDHKSNAEIERENKWNKFCLDPISHIPDTHIGHYGLQLNLYEYLLKYGGYVPKNAQFKLFLNHVTSTKAELIELPNYQLEIRDLIIDNLLKN
jgi:ATP-dependent exoDNAse (exonuclease V) beta subunit